MTKISESSRKRQWRSYSLISYVHSRGFCLDHPGPSLVVVELSCMLTKEMQRPTSTIEVTVIFVLVTTPIYRSNLPIRHTSSIVLVIAAGRSSASARRLNYPWLEPIRTQLPAISKKCGKAKRDQEREKSNWTFHYLCSCRRYLSLGDLGLLGGVQRHRTWHLGSRRSICCFSHSTLYWSIFYEQAVPNGF